MSLLLQFDVKNNASKEALRLKKDLDSLSISTQKSEKTFLGFDKSLVKVAGGFLALKKAIDLSQEFVRQADAFSQLNSQLKLVTTSSQNLLQVRKELFQISQESRVGLKDTADLYARIARSTKNANVSQEELLNVTETISKTLIISGASAESANAALVQLGQGFAADALRGQELNSVLEQTPRLAQAIAEGLGKDLGELRKIAAEGQLTTKVVLDALQTQAGAVNDEFKQVEQTASQGFTQASNSALLLVGKLDEVLAITETVAIAFVGLSRFIDSVSDSVESFFKPDADLQQLGLIKAITKASNEFVRLEEAANSASKGGFGANNFEVFQQEADEAKKVLDELISRFGVLQQGETPSLTITKKVKTEAEPFDFGVDTSELEKVRDQLQTLKSDFENLSKTRSEIEKEELQERFEANREFITQNEEAYTAYTERLINLDKQIAEEHGQRQIEKLEAEGGFFNGVEASALQYQENVGGAFEIGQQAFKTFTESATDSLFELATTGKASSKDLAKSLITDIGKVLIQRQVAAATEKALELGLLGVKQTVEFAKQTLSTATAATEVAAVTSTTPIIVGAEATKTSAAATTSAVSSMEGIPFPWNLAALAATVAAIGTVISGGFAEGGFTGNGGKFEPAGTVHKGEFVFTKEQTRKIGVNNLENFANGGAVAPVINSVSGGNRSGGVTIIINESSNASATVSTQEDDQGNIDVMVSIVEKSIANGISQGTGDVSEAIENTFSLGRG